MKKILVVLLVLAVAGGVFAQQGEWSLSGKVEIGTRIDFDPDPEVRGGDDPAMVTGITWGRWDALQGSLGIGYTRGVFTSGIDVNNKGGLGGNIAFNGENFKAKAALSWNKYWDLPNYDDWRDDGAAIILDQLWGEYGFFNGILNLHVAYNTTWGKYWASDETGTFFDAKYGAGWKTEEDPFGTSDVFATYDHHDLLKLAVNLGDIEFGVAMTGNNNVEHGLFRSTGGWTNDPTAYETKLLDAIKWSLVGVKFTHHPFEIAGQFRFADYSIYFGGKFGVGPVTFGLSFMGTLDGDYENKDNDPKHIKFGGRADYDGGIFGAGIKAFYDFSERFADKTQDVGNDLSAVGIEPIFFFNALPNNLRFQLDFGLYFLTDKDTGGDKQKAIIWAVQPQVVWNFLGTGAKGYGDVQTGIGVRYRMAAADTSKISLGGKYSANFFDLSFKWGF